MSSNVQSVPASRIQRQFWLAQQREPGGSVCNVASVHWIRGNVEPRILFECIQETVAHHAILRSTYRLANGVLWQDIHETAQVDHSMHSVGDLDAAAAQAKALELVHADASRPFDLLNGPVVRITWVDAPACDVKVLGLVIHHIAVDLRSKELLSREITARYRAKLARGSAFVPAACGRPYEEFAAIESKWLASVDARKATAHWQSHLKGADFAPALPLDQPRSGCSTSPGSARGFRLPGSLHTPLLCFCKERALDPFVVLLAAYRVLLTRYSGSTNFVIGVPLSNRRVGDFAHTVGSFVNILPLAGALPYDCSFETAVRQTRQTLLEAHRHQELPLEMIVNAVGGGRNADRNPVFQIGFTREPPFKLVLPGVSCESSHGATDGAQLDLFFRYWDSDSGIEGRLEYNTSLFRGDTASRLTENFLVLLESALAAPTRPVAQLDLISARERAQLKSFNETAVSYSFCAIHERIAKMAQAHRDSTALVFGTDTLTYGELEQRATTLAKRLVRCGVGPNRLVAVYMERSPDMVIALYGVLKSGGAYVPIDPDYPEARIAFMLKDAAAPVVITQAHLLHRLPASDATRLCMDRDDVTMQNGPEVEPAKAATPDQLAYMIYTSGSTGAPKGALNTHGGIDNRLQWMQEYYQLTPRDAVIQKTPFSFDVSVWEFFWPLLVGARLVIAKPGAHRDPREIAKLIKSENVTVVHFVPSMLRHFLEEPATAECVSLRHVVCSGEALPAELQNHFFRLFSGAQLHNLYGPTEAAVDVTHWTCVRNDARRFVPIGRPVANTQIHILTEDHQPVPIGVSGELYIGGVQVAQGYHARPDLNAERFLPDAFSTRPGGRLYKTGDRGRWLSDGTIEYLGRTDSQVKIRGVRIELGEIETTLRSHSAVVESVVVSRDRPDSEAQIVAYVVLSTPGMLESDQLKAHCRARLPEFLVPAIVMTLSDLPRLPNGKVDRNALPPPTPLEPRIVSDQSASELELQVAAIWRDVLGVAPPDNDANFFDIGGDSLRLLSVRSQLQQLHCRPIEMIDMFRHSTVRSLAEFLSSAPADSPAKTRPQTLEPSRANGLRLMAARRSRLSVPSDSGNVH